MSYEPKLPRSTQIKIKEYLDQRYPAREAHLLALEEIRLALLRLAANPRQGTSPPGLFETRPVHRFFLQADGIRRDVQICFCYDPDDPKEATIIITDFMPIPY